MFYDPLAGVLFLFMFLAVPLFFVMLLSTPWLLPMMGESMADWWRQRGERELHRARAERERAEAEEARARADMVRELTRLARLQAVDAATAQWYVHQLQQPAVPLHLDASRAPVAPWTVVGGGSESRPYSRQATVVDGAARLIEQAHTALARRGW